MQHFDVDDVIEYSDFFTEMDFAAINRELNNGLWAWGHKSDMKKTTQLCMWMQSLSKNKFFSEYLLNKIVTNTGQQFKFERVYANGQTFGMKGYPHEDSQNPKGRTFLYYPMTQWDPQWGGKTCFRFPTAKGWKYHFIVPEPNKAILFPGIITHWAEETSRTFAGLRITVAWKLELP